MTLRFGAKRQSLTNARGSDRSRDHKGATLLALALIAAGCSRTPSPERRVLYYYDPMHPAYRSDRPGIAPDCGMKMVPKYAGESAADRSIHLTKSEERAAGIETVE